MRLRFSHVCLVACCALSWLATPADAQETAPHPAELDQPAGAAPNAADATPADAAATPAGDAGTVPEAPPPDEPEPPESYRLPPPPPATRYPAPTLEGERSPFEELRIPSRISTRLHVLSVDLDALAASGGSGTASGVLAIVTGGLSITLGALFENDAISAFFFVFGGASLARGVSDLVFSPDADTPALEFAHMPMRDTREVRLRLRFGEDSLERLAIESRISRMVDGGISIAAGVLIVPLALAPNDFSFSEPIDYFVIIGAAISVLSGVISLVSESEAERRWAQYDTLRRRLHRERKRARPRSARVQAAIAPSQDGLRLVLRGSF